MLSPTLTHFVLCTSYQYLISLRLNRASSLIHDTGSDILAPAVIYTSSQITSSFHLSIPTPLSVHLCVPVAGQCWCAFDVCMCVCVWTCVRWLTFVSLEAENHGACGFFARHNVWGCVFFVSTQSLIQHPHWCVCRSAVNTLASLSLSVSVFFVWRLKTCPPVRVRPTDCLTSSLVCAMQFWPNVSSLSLFPHIGLFDVIRLLFIFWHPRPSCCSRRRCSSACKYLCPPHPPPHTLCLSVYPVICPSGASQTVEMRSVPKTAWALLPLCTNTSSLFTNWFSPYRLIHPQVTRGYKHLLALSEELQKPKKNENDDNYGCMILNVLENGWSEIDIKWDLNSLKSDFHSLVILEEVIIVTADCVWAFGCPY